MKTMSAIGFAAAIVACAPAHAATPAEEIASARPIIEAANADWVPAMQAHDAARIAAAYAKDGVFVLPDGRVLSGRAAIEAAMKARFMPGVTFPGGGLHQDGLAYAEGGLIFEWGHGGITSRDALGQGHTSEGPYLTVWKRGATGRWEIIRNMAF
jgi:uncharacterized protein (TIGR02246 family)